MSLNAYHVTNIKFISLLAEKLKYVVLEPWWAIDSLGHSFP